MPELSNKYWHKKKYRDNFFQVYRSKLDELKIIYETASSLIKVSFTYIVEMMQENGEWKLF